VKRPDDGKSIEVHEAKVVALNSDLASEIEIKNRKLGAGVGEGRTTVEAG